MNKQYEGKRQPVDRGLVGGRARGRELQHETAIDSQFMSYVNIS